MDINVRNRLIKNENNEETIQYDDYIAGLAKGLTLLECFGMERQKLSITQISERSGLSRTAARRYIRTLKFLGYLDTDEHFYWLTHKVLRFSSAYLSSASLPKIVQPMLNLLSTKTALSFSVTVLDEHEVVPIARSISPHSESTKISPLGIHLGNRLPAYATSTGKILLACLSPEAQLQWLNKFPLKRLTPYTITDTKLFLQTLDQINQYDYCISAEEHELGIIALAVPILNLQGDTVAALNCIGSSQRINYHYLLQNILPLLKQTAHDLRAII
ncbi:IclR family transcriptional regulator domain-containing protein [Acinetobacter indicus]|uniref:IclR family transcriptional regulator domain-containing protein n=1 Tax=Acinetobacter indicus TaxID=756892 RepID=UPI001443DA63|nr:IclR family transcriptional regulator C-terminal domain-containing protein [Acinetobacter indicus]